MEKVSYYRLILLKIRWSPWNPWCLGRMNLAWIKYTQTTLYKDRKKLEKEQPVSFSDYAHKAFIDNYEIEHFVAIFTSKDKIKLFLAPFSFGSKFRMPFRRLEDRILMKN